MMEVVKSESHSCKNSLHCDQMKHHSSLTQTEHGSDVSLLRHNYARGDDEKGLLLNCKKDSLALQSVYRYVKIIEAFLGWEHVPGDFNLEEYDGSDRLLADEGCSSKDGSLDEIEKSVGDERPHKNTVVSVCDSGVCCDEEDNLEENRNIDLKNGEIVSTELFNEKDETDSKTRKDGTGSNCLQKIYRSEVRLVVEDYRSYPNRLATNLESRSYFEEISANMNESLGQGNEKPDSGLIINSEGSLLRKESISLSAPDDGNKFVSDCNGLIKTVEMVNVVDCNSIQKANASEIVDKLNEVRNESDQIVMSSDSQSRINGDQADLVTQNERKKSITKLAEQNKETEEINCREENKLENSEEFSRLNNGKLVQSSSEQKKTKSGKKIDNSLKVYIQYDDEQSRQSESKNTASGQTRRASRRLSLFSGDTICGMGIFRPRWLQPYATVKVYVVLYSIIGILHGSYYSYLIGTLSTLEKRFAFKSRISGVIMITDEITPLFLGVFIGYYAGKANRPRMISFGMLLSALCCFASSLPYFVYGPVQHLTVSNVQNNTVSEFCESGVSESCSYDDRPPTLSAVLILMLGSFFKGFGNLSYYAIGLAYLDDNSDKKSTPIYLAVSLALRLLGPLIGFLMSSAFLKLYEDPFDDPGFGPDDPRWIGAWWIGFFLQGVLLVIFTLPIALFPRRLPGRKSMDKTTAPKSKDSWKQIFEGLLSALKRLGKNPVFVLLIIYTNAKIFGQFGHSIMLPKYMENQFRLSASEASLYSGATSITCVMIATVVGGFFIWKFRPGIKPLIGGIIVSDLLMCIGFLVLMIPRCQPANMVNFGSNKDGLILENACNQMCDCSTTSFTPFCGPDGKTYFSPCYAGCSNESATTYESQKEFHNCSCVAYADNQTLSSTISEGLCPDDSCWVNALIYLVILLIIVSISNSFTVVYTMVLLRTVHPNDKSIALGTFETFICLFGFIPFPITIGALVDSACLVWEQSCGETGNCWFYDMDKFAYLLHGVSASFCFLAVICMFTLYFMSSRIRDLYADDDDEKTHVVNIKLDTVSESVTKL